MTTQNRLNSSTDDCLELLVSRVLPIWPKPGDREAPEHAESLAPLLADDFDPVDLANRISDVAEVTQISLDADCVEIQFHDLDGCPQQAVFTRRGSDAWALRSLKFQCPACFGSGVNNGAGCEMCGGAGWGVA